MSCITRQNVLASKKKTLPMQTCEIGPQLLNSQNEFGSIPFFFILCNRLRNNGTSSSLKVCQKLMLNPSSSGLFLQGDEYLLVVDLFELFMFYQFILTSPLCLGTFFFQIVQHFWSMFVNYLLMTLWMLLVPVFILPFFILNFINWSLLSSLAQSLSLSLGSQRTSSLFESVLFFQSP